MSEKNTNKRTNVQIDRKIRDLAHQCRTRLPLALQHQFGAWSAWSCQLVLLGLADFERVVATEGVLSTNYTTSLHPSPIVMAIPSSIMERARAVAVHTQPHPTALGTPRDASPTSIVRWALRRGIELVTTATPDPEAQR